jgi:acetyl-CoA acetyltransferase
MLDQGVAEAEMRRRPEVEFGLATMCIWVGQGIAMVVERGG